MFSKYLSNSVIFSWIFVVLFWNKYISIIFPILVTRVPSHCQEGSVLVFPLLCQWGNWDGKRWKVETLTRMPWLAPHWWSWERAGESSSWTPGPSTCPLYYWKCANLNPLSPSRFFFCWHLGTLSGHDKILALSDNFENFSGFKRQSVFPGCNLRYALLLPAMWISKTASTVT